VNLATLIEDHGEQLTRAERRVAAGVLNVPQSVTPGTLASVTCSIGTSGTTIIRLAAKLGLGGLGSCRRWPRTTWLISCAWAGSR
jgi:DNA-binding MurR/RpiR family transcriptional regulator